MLVLLHRQDNFSFEFVLIFELEVEKCFAVQKELTCENFRYHLLDNCIKFCKALEKKRRMPTL